MTDDLAARVATLEAQVALLMRIAVANGDATVNQARATLGLPDFNLAGTEPAPAT